MRKNQSEMFASYEKGLLRTGSMLSETHWKRYTRKQLTGGLYPEDGVTCMVAAGILEKSGQCTYKKTGRFSRLTAKELHRLMYPDAIAKKPTKEAVHNVPNTLDIEILAQIAVLFKKINGREPYMDEAIAIYSVIRLESKAA